jgi:flavodoxin
MKYIFQFFVLMLVTLTSCGSNQEDEPNIEPTPSAYFNGDKVLVAYFSWGGNTRSMAEQIQTVTGGDIFEIVPETAYPTAYTPCTEVALEEKNNDARPAIKNRVQNWEQYNIVFIGCPVWWWTTPMIIHTFAESYDFAGKTVVPFCTYSATYRDETLQTIVDITPKAKHLQGLGTTNSSSTVSGITTWIESISNAYSK